MKKAIRLMALLLALVMCFSVAGCGKTTTEEFISVWEDVEDDGETGDSGNGATDSQSGTSSKDNGNTVTSTPSNSNEYVDSDNLELRKKYESTHDVYNNAKLKGTTVKFATWTNGADVDSLDWKAQPENTVIVDNFSKNPRIRLIKILLIKPYIIAPSLILLNICPYYLFITTTVTNKNVWLFSIAFYNFV